MKPYNHELAALCREIADKYAKPEQPEPLAAMLDEMTDNNAHQLRRIIEQYNISHKDAQMLLNYSEGRGPFDNGEVTT